MPEKPDHFYLADIFSKHVSNLVERGKEVVAVPRLGLLAIDSPYAEAVDKALRILVDNVLQHGGDKVWLRCARRGDGQTGFWLAIEVIDDGPGFNPVVFYGASSLANLHARLHRIGGEITVWTTTEGTLVRLEFQLVR